MLGVSNSRKLYFANTGEILTGKVNGDDASDIEERSAKYHQKNGIAFWFRPRINPLAIPPKRELSKKEQIAMQYQDKSESLLYKLFIQKTGIELPEEPTESPITTERHNIIGELEIDILSNYNGVMYPLMIQGEISHFMTPAQREKDAQKISRINEVMLGLNAHPAVVIPFWVLRNQTITDNTMRNGYATGWNIALYDL